MPDDPVPELQPQVPPQVQPPVVPGAAPPAPPAPAPPALTPAIVGQLVAAHPKSKVDQFLQTWWLAIAVIAVVGGGALVGAYWFNPQIKFVSQKDLDLVRALTPLAIAAVFIERAVEVLISPWRDTAADAKEQAVKVATDAADTPETDPTVQGLLQDLNRYKGNTKRVAFLLGFVLSLMAALVGVRALGPFLADNGLHDLKEHQQHLFWGFDVLLTAAVLPGGADLVHTIFNTFSSVFDKVQRSASK